MYIIKHYISRKHLFLCGLQFTIAQQSATEGISQTSFIDENFNTREMIHQEAEPVSN